MLVDVVVVVLHAVIVVVVAAAAVAVIVVIVVGLSLLLSRAIGADLLSQSLCGPAAGFVAYVDYPLHWGVLPLLQGVGLVRRRPGWILG